MSKQEILSWTSLTASISIIVFYFLIVIGWPSFLPDYSDRLVKIFFNLFWIAVIIEIIVEIGNKKKAIDKDERDFMIEAHGLRYAYNFLMTALAIVVVNLFIYSLFGEFSPHYAWIVKTNITFHILFIMLFIASAIKRVTMIYHYRKTF